MNSGAKITSIPPGQRVEPPHHDEQDREADDEVDERDEDGSERKQRAREVDLRHEIEVRGQAHARARERGCEVLHREDAGHHEHLVLHAPGREVRETAEHDDVDGGREDGHEDGPGDPQEGLLVAHDHVAPDERAEQLAEVPELGEIEARPARRRP